MVGKRARRGETSPQQQIEEAIQKNLTRFDPSAFLEGGQEERGGGRPQARKRKAGAARAREPQPQAIDQPASGAKRGREKAASAERARRAPTGPTVEQEDRVPDWDIIIGETD